ncbi:MAG: peptidylprolyl isomerase [Prevotellaceae bacterium]|jgi:peptidyl-prolyl cis-trans isomerase SurA|nr:peptidylprolyl isomerase [Prevotellaceae bacterium]
MKRIFFSLSLFVAFFANAQNEVLMTVGSDKITKSEFEYIYNKNNSDNAIDKKTLDEYVELFKVFKLKVAEAKALKLDTTQAFVNELAGYRSQLANNFLLDKALEEKLKNEAFDRMREVANVSHILLRLPEFPTPADTLAVYNRALEIRKRLEKEDFETVAREVSEDPSAQQNGGTLGNITAFMMVYPFENAAFNTPVGKISQPVRTQFGYHLVRVNSRQANPGEVLIAHISLNAPKNVPADTLKAKEQKINDIYKRIKAGESFESLVHFSDDKSSPTGELPWFGVGRILPEIERTAFSLKVGEVAAPVQSPMGFHIIKLLDRKPFELTEQRKAELEKQFNASGERASLPVFAFIDNLRKEYNLQVNQTSLNDFYELGKRYAVSDSLFKVEAAKFSDKPLFTFADQTATQADFANYLAAKNFVNTVESRLIIDESLKNLQNKRLFEYASANLENINPEFRNLMQEYRDGILLFEISNQNVWEKAAQDTLGLEQFYATNREKYTWQQPHFKGRVISAPDEETADKARNIIRNAPKDSIDARLRASDITTKIRIQRGLFAQGDNAAVDKLVFNTGDFTPGEKYPVVFIAEGGELLAEPQELADVRGQVTADYQNFLEENWVKELKEKYPVVVFEDVLKTIKKN